MPDAVSVTGPYGWNRVPFGRLTVLITGGAAGRIVSVRVFGSATRPVLVWVNPMTTCAVLAARVGVPEMTPVLAFSDRPAGSGEAVQVPAGLPAAVSVTGPYGARRRPSGRFAVVMTGSLPAPICRSSVLVGAATPVPDWVNPMTTCVLSAVTPGVPEMMPVSASRLRPTGSGEAVQVPVTLPTVVSWNEYGVPRSPGVSAVVAISGAAGLLTVSVSALLALRLVLVWVNPIVTGVVPAVVGVPEMTPVSAFRLRPFGSAEAVQVPTGLPAATRVCEYATPTVPAFRAVVEMTGSLAGPTCSVSVLVGAVSPLLVWVKPKVMFLLPGALGKPDRTPVFAFSDRPVPARPIEVQVPTAWYEATRVVV